MEPLAEQQPDEPEGHLSRSERAKAQAAAIQARAKLLAERAQVERQRHASVDAVFEMADRDSEVGGGIMAGALAYRLFIWLLPAALVAVAGLGVAARASSNSPESEANSLGVAGVVSSSIADAANSPARWYALLVGIPILIYTTRSVLRTLIVVHRLVWADVRAAVPKPKLGATLQLLTAFIGFFVIAALASLVRASSVGGGLVVMLLIPLPFAALWLLISMRLPHRVAPSRALIPGAIFVGVGLEALHIVAAYAIAPYAASKQGTYGSLGTAAALLLGLFVISRLVVASAVLNATLWQRAAAKR